MCLASILPFVSTLNGYFLSDDFGVVQLLSRKPTFHALSLFTSPWTEAIYGTPADELRPTLALLFQFNSQWGAALPIAYHVTNLASHMLTTLVVFGIARAVGRLTLVGATLAAVTFAVLPIHAETMGWLQGVSDSVPTLFYLGSFLAYAVWSNSGRRRLYVLSVVVFFLALFTKQSMITMFATLVAYDVLIRRMRLSQLRQRLSAYSPFVVLTIGYLILRYHIFGSAVRETAFGPAYVVAFGRTQLSALQLLLLGRKPPYVEGDVLSLLIPAAGLVGFLALLGFTVFAARRYLRQGSLPRTFAQVTYFGPVWWIIGTGPLLVAYSSPRHLYLASVGLVIILGLGFDALWIQARGFQRWTTAAGGAAFIAVAVLLLQTPLAEWNAAANISQRIVVDAEREANAAPPGSLLLIGAPLVYQPTDGWRDVIFLWAWAMPYGMRPPFAQTDLTARVYTIERQLVYCCQLQWLPHVRATIQAWSSQPGPPPVIALRWHPSTGALTRQSAVENPHLRDAVLGLARLATAEEVSTQIEALLQGLGD